MCGIISRTISAARFSCAVLSTDHTKEMATVSTPSLTKDLAGGAHVVLDHAGCGSSRRRSRARARRVRR